jgi:hypothetical protein
MRYFLTLMAYVASIAVAVASCSAGTGSAHHTGSGGSQGTSSGQVGGAGGNGGSSGTFTTSTGFTTSSSSGAGGVPCAAYKGNCTEQGFMCGQQSDGCGNILQCGTCATGETCGGGATPKPGVCGSGTSCAPKTCADQGFTCGMATDTCGTVIDCGTCPGGVSCGVGKANTCDTCTNLCLQQQACDGGTPTTITGTVYAPNGTDPLYNTLVYVPNSAVQPFTPGVTCGSCSADVTGSPLVSAVTGVDGTFTITNAPSGSSIPLVIQNGRWRRQVVIPTVTACASTAVPASLTHMPTSKAQGDIPLMAFATGSVDSLECVLLKIGILPTEFTDPGGTGRIQFYVGSGDFGTAGGAQTSLFTPSETQLVGTLATMKQYDMIYFPCQGGAFAQSSTALANLVSYANAGGRVFATHYSYVWLATNSPFSTTAAWAPDPNDNNTFADDPGLGVINQGFTQGLALAQWLKLLYPTSTLGQIQINTLRHDFVGVVAPSELWISDQDPPPSQGGLGTVPMHYTFDTPVGATPANQCGRVLYDDFHVEDADNDPTNGEIFPDECNANPMTPQEKMLEFMIFDLGSCVAPPVCTPTTCAQQNVTCGLIGDGCGNILPSCGACPSGMSCVSGKCGNSGPPCVPKTCADQGFNCGMATDTCGTVINCGTCVSPQTCGGGIPPKANVCGGFAPG